MTIQDEQLRTLHEIRNIMNRSERFQALSGLSGILVGIIALVGAGALRWYLSVRGLTYADLYAPALPADTARFTLGVLGVVLILAAVAALYFTGLKARKAGQSAWNAQARRVLINFCLPLAVGGAFCGALLYHSIGYLLAPSMLIFYGLALINTSRYTFGDLRSLGVCEIALGLLSSFAVSYGLLAWALGFGLLHVVYGGVLYFKYEKKTTARNL